MCAALIVLLPAVCYPRSQIVRTIRARVFLPKFNPSIRPISPSSRLDSLSEESLEVDRGLGHDGRQGRAGQCARAKAKAKRQLGVGLQPRGISVLYTADRRL